jgi:GDP-4-dehydro-6-deoxy-D-mannose reductase
MNKILILGCNGFTGDHTLRYIQNTGLLTRYEFCGVDVTACANQNIRCHQADLSNEAGLEKIILQEKPDYIINLIGAFRRESYAELETINAKISRTIFETVVKNNLTIKKIVLVGSAAEYGTCQDLPIIETTPVEPVNFYGLSKVVQMKYAEYYKRVHHLNVAIARTFNIIGENMPKALSISSFVRQIEDMPDEGVIEVGNLNSKRDFLDIYDVVDAYFKILFDTSDEFIYNVCSRKSIRMMDMLEHLIEKSGKKISISVKKERMQHNDIPDSYGDNTILKNKLGWCAKHDVFTSLEKMIKK